MGAVVGGLAVLQGPYRGLEAAGAAWLARGVFGTPASAYRPLAVVVAQRDHANAIGIQVTAECTSAMVVMVLAVVAGAMAAASRRGPRRSSLRMLTAFGISALTVIVANELRLAFLAAAYHWWGFHDGFVMAHLLYGSLVSIAGMVLGVLAFASIIGRDRGRIPR